MMNKFVRASIAFFVVAILSSCGGKQEAALEPIKFSEWETQLESYQGKIVVADLWAMWCAPCIKRFPKMVELHQEYADKGVEFVSINFDEASDTEMLENADTFLKEMNAVFDNFYFNENLIDAFEFMEVIGLPTVVVYNRQGEEAKRLDGTNPNSQFTEDDIVAEIERLLAAG